MIEQRITYNDIVNAKNGDESALNKILKRYRPYIKAFCHEFTEDEFGLTHDTIDLDMVHQIESKLMLQIIYAYDLNREDDGSSSR